MKLKFLFFEEASTTETTGTGTTGTTGQIGSSSTATTGMTGTTGTIGQIGSSSTTTSSTTTGSTTTAQGSSCYKMSWFLTNGNMMRWSDVDGLQQLFSRTYVNYIGTVVYNPTTTDIIYRYFSFFPFLF